MMYPNLFILYFFNNKILVQRNLSFYLNNLIYNKFVSFRRFGSLLLNEVTKDLHTPYGFHFFQEISVTQLNVIACDLYIIINKYCKIIYKTNNYVSETKVINMMSYFRD